MSWRLQSLDLLEEEEEEAGAVGELFQLADSVLELVVEQSFVLVVEVAEPEQPSVVVVKEVEQLW